MNLIFIEVHTDGLDSGRPGAEIIPSGWYTPGEARLFLKKARRAIKEMLPHDAENDTLEPS
jgi:hypothetical protein